eukprot:scaffold6278_cov105-Cylindrotheca_fusiformis.AAC.2
MVDQLPSIFRTRIDIHTHPASFQRRNGALLWFIWDTVDYSRISFLYFAISELVRELSCPKVRAKIREPTPRGMRSHHFPHHQKQPDDLQRHIKSQSKTLIVCSKSLFLFIDSHDIMRFHFMFRCFCFFFLCILLVSQWTHAQESFSDEELAALSDAELELICLVRGFELVKDHIDEATGEKYELTHDDYVDAAKQCLAVEEEM